MSGRRVVFDTNIFLSAFTFGGKPEVVFEMVRAGRIQLIVSTSILAERGWILQLLQFGESLGKTERVVFAIFSSLLSNAAGQGKKF